MTERTTEVTERTTDGSAVIAVADGVGVWEGGEPVRRLQVMLVDVTGHGMATLRIGDGVANWYHVGLSELLGWLVSQADSQESVAAALRSVGLVRDQKGGV